MSGGECSPRGQLRRMVRSGGRLTARGVEGFACAEVALPSDRMFMSQSSNFISKMYYYTYRE